MVRLTDSKQHVVVQTDRFDYYLAPQVMPSAQNYPDNVRLAKVKRGRLYALITKRFIDKKGQPYLIQVAYNVTHNRNMLARLITNTLIISSVALIVMLLVILLLVYYGLRPFQKVKNAIQSLDSENLNKHLPTETVVLELLPIVDAFNRLLVRIEKDFDKLKAFSANIAHELRTPINNLMVETELLLSGHLSKEVKQDVLVSSMEEYQRLASIIDRLLFLARYDERKGNVATELLDCLSEVALVVDFHQALADKRGVNVKIVGQGEIFADPTLLRNALTNILTNAIKYTDKGGEVVITISSLKSGAKVVISDTGPGVPQAKLSYLTDKFYRVDSHRSSTTGGSGLGLAIVKTILAAHHGQLTFENAKPHGLIVTMFFPS